MFDYSVICTCTTLNIREGKRGVINFTYQKIKKNEKTLDNFASGVATLRIS